MRRSLPVLLLVFAACTSAPTPPAAPPEAPRQTPRKVVLLSLDGAGADEIRRLWRQGVLSEGGFARFFQEGQVAERLVNINPTLTAPNHISLGTGYDASRTGIVANTIHLPGKPLTETVSGFDHTIETETLWEAAKRQGRRVAVNTFPGADGKGERRTADWGMVYVNWPDRRPEVVELDRNDWRLAADGGRETTIEVSAGKPEAQTFDLRAENGVLILEGQTLAPGAWVETPCLLGSYGATCRVKLLEASPDLQSVRIYFNGVYKLRAYPPEFLDNLTSRGLYWPGEPDGWSGLDVETWTEQTERFARFFGDSLVATAEHGQWDLLMGYMPVIDEAGHEHSLLDPVQPRYSEARRAERERARYRVWKAVDRELARLLNVLDLRDTVVVLVSDHGMSLVHTTIDPNVLLQREKLLAADGTGKILEKGTVARAVGSGGISHVYLAPGRHDLIPRLRELFSRWTVEGVRPIERAVTREEAGDFQLNHPNSGDLILFVRPGFSAHGGLLDEGVPDASTTVYGMHGYLNKYPQMHGIFLALGGGLRPGSAGTVRTTEVAGRVAEWMGMEKPRPRPAGD